MATAYVPDAGEVVWLEFDPQAGHEQAGHRPACPSERLVVTPGPGRGKGVNGPHVLPRKVRAFEAMLADLSIAVIPDPRQRSWRRPGRLTRTHRGARVLA